MNTKRSTISSQRATPVRIVLLTLTISALSCSAATLVTSSVDGGGGRSGGGSYTNDGCVGGIVGMADSGSGTNRIGYIGQLSETASLAVTGTPATVNETASTQLSGAATLDDATITLLTGTDITWSTPSWPIQVITASGVATTMTVYANQSGAFSGRYLGVLGNGSLLVLDSQPDNYGSYAGDGLRDGWQVQYFGIDNPNAAPNKDVTGTGQNNLFKYTAGLDPTNAASVFRLRIEAVTGQSNQKQLIFAPRWSDRTYTPMYRTNLVSGASWTNLVTTAVTDNGTERTVTDTNATDNARFYRIQITYP